MVSSAATRKDWLKEYVCGAVAGSANVLTGFPFDTVKVHLQALNRPQKAWTCASNIYRKQGVRGFFQGVKAPLVGGAVECGVNYLVYSRLLALFAGPSDATASAAEIVAHDIARRSPAQVLAAAAGAGGALSLVLSPAELIKCRLQLHGDQYGSTWRCVKLTVATEGLRGLARGLGATIAREVPGNAVFFLTYESVKQWTMSLVVHLTDTNYSTRLGSPDPVCGDRSIGAGHAPPCVSHAQPESSHSPPMATGGRASLLQSIAGYLAMVLSGGLAGCVMWSIVLPIDTAKTRLQAASPGQRYDVGLLANLRILWAEGGCRALWAGLGPTLLRAFPANAMQWLAWEACMQLCASL